MSASASVAFVSPADVTDMPVIAVLPGVRDIHRIAKANVRQERNRSMPLQTTAKYLIVSHFWREK